MSEYINKSFLDFTFFVNGYLNSVKVVEFQCFKPKAGSLIDRGGKINIDFIAKVGTLSSDVQEFCDEYNENIELHHFNSSKKGDFNSYYNEDLRDIVYEKYKADFEQLGYCK